MNANNSSYIDSKPMRQPRQSQPRNPLPESDIENQFISKICQALSLAKTENRSRILAKQLLINGRQEIMCHRDDIAPTVFDNQMVEEGNSPLLEILKDYFQQQWQQVQFDWFHTFIVQQQTKNNDKQYQQVLTRTAEYGQKYMKGCPVFSIVLQLVFAFDDDIDNDETIFDNVWNTFAMNGCKAALEKWKKYIVPAVMKEHIDSHNSPLFLALREYFRDPVHLLFNQSKITDQRNLLETILDCLANNGWTAALNDDNVKRLIPETKYKLFTTNLKKYLEDKGLVLFTSSNDLFVAYILGYIADLPSYIEENDLGTMIENRLEVTQRMKVKNIKCYSKLGVGVIKMMNDDDKNHLVSNVESIVLDKNLGITISFVDELKIDSYIVIDQKVSNIPSVNDVGRSFSQAYKTSKVHTCETVSIQFPNIFRIFLNTLDELDKIVNRPDFRITNISATVYPRADSNFFEDLPQYTNDEKLASAIAAQIGESRLPPACFYIQHNRKTGNAIVIASKSAKKWSMASHLTIDGQNIPKKVKLAYRVLISPIPRGFNVDKVLRHKLFAGRVVSHKHVDDKLVVELNDLDHYNECIGMGGFGIDGNTMAITEHTLVSNPDSSELDAVNWYETAMFDIKPDITTLINNHQHPIFRYKWNAENWIQQMKKAETIDRSSKGYDLTRHLLRVTVMLNTIAILRKKKYVVNNDEIILKVQRMKTIVYDHETKLLKGKRISESEFKTPYSSTTVKVINEDCLVLYEQLANDGCRPLLLNMANAVNPGGGYRTGDGAQEENIFRRSDYYHSLDSEIADKDRSERFVFTSKCELKLLKGFGDLYPMEEFGAIYTSGITVFRGIEAKGYPYMKEPLYNVCAIAMAAYRNPSLIANKMLTNKFATNTHKKIENIFAIGYQNKHDCLVLSAFGCGAFKNPPKHVALLFKSVIYQYAGYFDTIYFAITDDHNTGGNINPDGNFLPFKQLLDGLKVQPSKIFHVNGVTGPHRILDKTPDGQLTLSDACISYLPPCSHGTRCRDMKNADHNREFLHPPRCSLSLCDQMDDDVHTSTFNHIPKCKYGSECDSKDPTHLTDYDHPDFCKNQFRCCDISPEHLIAYRHLPVCQDGIECSKYLKGEDEHIKSFLHRQSICLNDNCCSQFHDDTHIRRTIHSFRPPCPFTPYTCSMYIQFFQANDSKQIASDVEKHCLQYSHVCPYGRQCKTTDDKHYEATIHIARHLCSNGNKCPKLTKEDHLESFTHLSIRDIRLLCKFPGFECQQRFKDDHLTKYRHGQNHNQFSVAPSSNLNSHINFVQNQNRLIKTINSYSDASGWKKANISQEICNWIRALQPVHRCNPLIFESILVHGHVMSRRYMKLLENPRCVAEAVLQHSRVRLIFLKHNTPATKDNAFNLIHALVKTEFARAGALGTTTLDLDHQEQINTSTMRLKASLNDNDLKVIYDWTVKIARASIKLHGTPMGIGYNVDEALGTDQHVFSILGQHLGYYYGDIVIVFKQEIMFHPDANFSIQAGTRFHSGNIYPHRPWVRDQRTEKKRVEDFHSSKLHCCVPRYERAAAIELTAITGMNKRSMNVTLNEVIQRWMNVDSHEVFESHLPQLIPLDYIDCVYIPKNIFDSLTPEAQQSARVAFKESLIFGPHVINPTRQHYIKFIVDKIHEKIQQRINTPHISRGIVITVPGSKFDQHIVLPMTISASYDLYRDDNNKESDYSYIYWQAMHGDMMLTISNQIIQSRKEQPNLQCVICYIARKPSTATEHYHENYSYLNDGHPFQHDTNVHEGKFRAKSNVFYRGCNTDDFLTFCLKLNHKTSEVTLSHAGPNGIYNHEKIHYQFNKSNLDFSKIDYIHVSGGYQDVPIRNLTINHEPVPELHPSFDKDFKIDTSSLRGKHRAPVEHIVRSSDDEKIPRNNNGSAPQPYRPRPVSVPSAAVTPQKSNETLLKPIKPMIIEPTVKGNLANSSKSSSNQGESHSLIFKPSDDDGSKSMPMPHNRSSGETPRSPRLGLSKLPPCHDSVYCLNQNDKDHIAQYSHPCRYNELCKKQDEPHLNHQPHNVPQCSDDKDCSEKTNPIHRAQYRHTGLPDYLIPCRFQDACNDRTRRHLITSFHGEELPLIKKTKTFALRHAGGVPKAH